MPIKIHRNLNIVVDLVELIGGLDCPASTLLSAMIEDEKYSGGPESLIAEALKECREKVLKLEDYEFNVPISVQVDEIATER
jgi:hypothetical protein